MRPAVWAVAGAAAGLGLIWLSIAVLDRPVALWVAAHVKQRLVFQAMASPSLLPLPLAVGFLALAALRRGLGGADFAAHGVLLRLALATLAATTAKDELKFVFGRAWPESLIKYHVYGFSPFAMSPLYGAFPSGHTAYMAAPMLVLCRMRPQLRPLWLAAIAMVMLGLVGGGYHFVGDTLAGLAVGAAAAWGTLALLPPQGAKPG